MRKNLFYRALRVLLVAFLILPFGGEADASSYKVGPGDQLYVDFPLKGTPADLQTMGGNGLTLVVVGNQVYFRYTADVAPDGFITLPSMDPLRVDGRTLEDIRDLISRHLRSFAVGSDLSVILSKRNSQGVYVTGEVKNPGRFMLDRPLTILEALDEAGGPTANAKLNKVLLVRGSDRPLQLDLSYKRLQRDGPPTLAVLPSDHLIVPRRWYTADNSIFFYLFSALGTAVAVYAATK